jgi:glucosylceramidase
VLKDAKAVNPELWLMGSPWTPPAFFKEKGTIEAHTNENTLIDDDVTYSTYAKYLVKVAKLFHSHGVHLSYLTLQNEPLFGTANYPGMYLNPQQAVRLGQQVKAQLAGAGLPPLKILAYDHNWDEKWYPMQALEAYRTPFVGTAWHCYGGDMKDAQGEMQWRHPEAEQHFTECTGWFSDRVCNINNGMQGFGWNHDWDMTNTLLGSVSYGSQSGMKWIMVLDEECGPYLPGVHFQSGRPLLSIPSWASSMADMKFNQDFWTIGHLARFIRPGAHRVHSELHSPSSPPAIIEAFRDDSARTLTLIAVNLDHDRDLPLNIDVGGKRLQYNLPRWSTVNMVWDL